jgi:hypothetical protein
MTGDGPFGFRALTPCRLLDSRISPGVPLDSGPPYNYRVKGVCGVPVAARAVFLNVAVVSPSAQGFVGVYPYPGPYPGISTVNVNAGERALANGAIVPLGTDGTFQLSAVYGTCCGGTTHLVLDVMGYFQ